MGTAKKNVRMLQKRGTFEKWTDEGINNNFCPLDGEIIYYTDLNKIKIGKPISNYKYYYAKIDKNAIGLNHSINILSDILPTNIKKDLQTNSVVCFYQNGIFYKESNLIDNQQTYYGLTIFKNEKDASDDIEEQKKLNNIINLSFLDTSVDIGIGDKNTPIYQKEDGTFEAIDKDSFLNTSNLTPGARGSSSVPIFIAKNEDGQFIPQKISTIALGDTEKQTIGEHYATFTEDGASNLQSRNIGRKGLPVYINEKGIPEPCEIDSFVKEIDFIKVGQTISLFFDTENTNGAWKIKNKLSPSSIGLNNINYIDISSNNESIQSSGTGTELIISKDTELAKLYESIFPTSNQPTMNSNEKTDLTIKIPPPDVHFENKWLKIDNKHAGTINNGTIGWYIETVQDKETGSFSQVLKISPIKGDGEYSIPDFDNFSAPWRGFEIDYVNLDAFDNNKKLVAIGDFAFAELVKLESFKIPNTITSIGKMAFAGAGLGNGLTRLEFETDDNEYYITDNSKSILYEKLNQEGWQLISYNDYNSLEYTILNKINDSPVRQIKAGSFYNNPVLTKVYFSNQIQNIEFDTNGPFIDCVKMLSVELIETNDSSNISPFKTINGVLYGYNDSKEYINKLLYYPPAKFDEQFVLKIPKEINLEQFYFIGANAFGSRKLPYLRKIIFDTDLVIENVGYIPERKNISIYVKNNNNFLKIQDKEILKLLQKEYLIDESLNQDSTWSNATSTSQTISGYGFTKDYNDGTPFSKISTSYSGYDQTYTTSNVYGLGKNIFNTQQYDSYKKTFNLPKSLKSLNGSSLSTKIYSANRSLYSYKTQINYEGSLEDWKQIKKEKFINIPYDLKTEQPTDIFEAKFNKLLSYSFYLCDNQNLNLTGIEEIGDYGLSLSPKVVIPSSIKELGAQVINVTESNDTNNPSYFVLEEITNSNNFNNSNKFSLRTKVGIDGTTSFDYTTIPKPGLLPDYLILGYGLNSDHLAENPFDFDMSSLSNFTKNIFIPASLKSLSESKCFKIKGNSGWSTSDQTSRTFNIYYPSDISDSIENMFQFENFDSNRVKINYLNADWINFKQVSNAAGISKSKSIPSLIDLSGKTISTRLTDASALKSYNICAKDSGNNLLWAVDPKKILNIQSFNAPTNEYLTYNDPKVADNIFGVNIFSQVSVINENSFTNDVWKNKSFYIQFEEGVSTRVIGKSVGTSSSDRVFTSPLKNLYVAQDSTTFGEYCCASCTINNLFLPKKFTLMNNAFSGATITNVYYNGTKDEWNELKQNLKETTGNEALTEKTTSIYFNGNSCGTNLRWSFAIGTNDNLVSNGTLTISLLDESQPAVMNDFQSKSEVPWDDLRNFISTVSLPDGLTSIGSYAFQDCVNLSSINLPQSISLIGSSVFDNTALIKDENKWENDCLYLDNCLIAIRKQKDNCLKIKQNTHAIAPLFQRRRYIVSPKMFQSNKLIKREEKIKITNPGTLQRIIKFSYQLFNTDSIIIKSNITLENNYDYLYFYLNNKLETSWTGSGSRELQINGPGEFKIELYTDGSNWSGDFYINIYISSGVEMLNIQTETFFEGINEENPVDLSSVDILILGVDCDENTWSENYKNKIKFDKENPPTILFNQNFYEPIDDAD